MLRKVKIMVEDTQHHHHPHISVMELGHLLTRSGLTYPEVSSKVCHDSFCQLGNSVSLPWVIYYGAYLFTRCIQFPLYSSNLSKIGVMGRSRTLSITKTTIEISTGGGGGGELIFIAKFETGDREKDERNIIISLGTVRGP